MLIRFYPPPIPGLGVDPPGSPSGFLRRQWIAGAWRRSSPALKLAFAITILAWWPMTVLQAAYLAARLGPSRRMACEKSPLRQFIEQVQIAALWMIPPRWYYMFELFDDERRAHAGDYIQRVQSKAFFYGRLVDRINRKYRPYPFADKIYFSALCHRHGLPASFVFATAGPDRFNFVDPRMVELPKTDLFVKIKNGRGGRGAEKWTYRDGAYIGSSGRVLDAQGLIADLKKKGRSKKRVVQYCLVNHSDLDDLNLGALATVRILTIRDERGGVEATHAVFRMPQKPGSPVDNFHAGGIAAPVDMASGRVGRATDIGLRPDSRWHEVHPTTGARIEGRILPHWNAALDLVRHAHRLIGDRVVVGWDVAILQEGPCLVEGNGRPDLDIMQRTYRVGLANSRFANLLVLHLKNRLADDPLNGRPIEEVYPERAPV